MKLKTVFFGTPEFVVPVLTHLNNHSAIELTSVVTMPDRPAGRGQKVSPPAIATACQEMKINCFQTAHINKDDDFLNELKNNNVDIFIVFAFAQFLSEKVLNIPRIGSYNIHTSLLPKYRRGAAPIQYALLNGDKETGVTIQKMVKKMDAGDIAHQRIIPIDENDNGSSLFEKLQGESIICLEEFIQLTLQNKIELKKQDESSVSFAPTIKKEEGLIDFKTMDATTIINKLRGYTPWPGIYCFNGNKRFKLLNIVKSSEKLNPGEVFTKKGQLIIGTTSDSLQLAKVQLEGKKPCSDIEFLNGMKNKKITLNAEAK